MAAGPARLPAFTHVNPPLRPPVYAGALAGFLPVGEATIARVGPGEVSAGVVLELAPSAFNLGEIRVVVDPDDAFLECDEGDNQVVVPDPR